MGILKPHIHLFCLEQKRHPIIRGDVLTLGQQQVYGTLSDIRHILAFHSLPAAELPAGFDTSSKIPGLKGTRYETHPNAQTLLTLLGADHVYAADISPREKPDFLIDLGEPVDVSYHARFDTILDVGTLEHVFDIGTALKNIVRMCRKGGNVILIHPSSGAIDHGFYQFSPTLYFDFFSSNGFSVVGCYLNEPLRCEPEDKRKGRILKYEHVGGQIPIASRVGFEVAFFARKNIVGDADGTVKPLQSLYRARQTDDGRSARSFPSAKAVVDNRPSWSFRDAAKKTAVRLGIPLPTNPWLRLIISFQFTTLATRLLRNLVDHMTTPRSWHPLWLNMYLFNHGRGGNIRCIAKYSASGDIRLLR